MSDQSAPLPPSPQVGALATGSRSQRWKKLLLVLAAVSFIGSFVLSLISWHIWQNRASYLSRYLNLMLPDLAPSIGQVELNASEFKLAQLTLSDPATSEPFATLRSASLTPYWPALRQRNIGQIQIDGLHLTTSTARLPALLTTFLPTATPTPETSTSSPFPAFSIADLQLTDLQVNLTGDHLLPSLQFTLAHQLNTLRLSPEGVPSLESTRFTLRDLAITSADGSTLKFPEAIIDASFDPSTGLFEVHDLQISQLDLSLLPALGKALQPLLQPSDSAPSELPTWFKGFVIHQAALDGLRLHAPNGLPTDLGLPAISLTTQLSYRVENLTWSPTTGFSHPGAHHLQLIDTAIAALDGAPGHLRFPRLLLDVRHLSSSGIWQIQDLTADGKPELHWTQALENALLGPSQPPAAPAPTTAPAPATIPPTSWLLAKLHLSSLQLHLEATHRMPLPLRGELTLHGQELQFTESKLSSSQPQRLLFTNVDTLIPGSRTAAPTTIDAIEIRLRPDALFGSGLIDRLHIVHPRLAYHLDLNAFAAGVPAPKPLTPPVPVTLPAFFSQLHFDDLAITQGELKIDGKWGAPFAAETSFSLSTESPIADSSLHTLTIAATRLTATTASPLPVAQVGEFQVSARLPELFTERRIETLLLKGGQVEFGEALIAILDPGKTPTNPPANLSVPSVKSTATPTPKVPFAPAKKWTAGKVAINDLSITLQKIAPGLPPLTFAVQFQAVDTPLEPAGLVENVDAQRIELSSLTIPAPYGSLRPVARLDSIFVHFTLEGLLRQRIQKVEILNPTLYVGEPLFWYVDYYRKFAAGEVKPGAERMALASSTNEVALNAATQALSTAAMPAKSWGIDELAVYAGKIILAPKGVPLPGFHQPFPFSFSTRLESGQLDAVFDIPSDNYPLPDFNLEFLGMRGQVRFNLPLRSIDNNLTETFTVDQIRWKQLHVEQAHLSVTYDMNGIYGKFGGEAYGGYIEGGFDVYLNENYTWDGWIAATNLLTTEITRKLTPAYFLLEGKVNGSLIAAGDASELYQADITFGNAAPGRFSIAALNDMLATLPSDITASLTDQITRIGIETLRDFDYDTVAAKGRFHGREGSGFLKITGPSGSRKFEVNVLDHRWKVDPPKPTSTASTSAP